MRRENLGKEVMIAIPAALVIQWNDKEVASLKGIQLYAAFLLTGDGIAQRTMQPVENGGLKQEASDMVGLTLQDLFNQIVHNVPILSCECTNKRRNVLAPAHRERRQLEPRNPAFGAGLEHRNFVVRKTKAHHLVEERGRFSGSKTQIGGTDLGQVAPGA
ncbi:hypothetical protein [Candidatus Pristimantibacillus sp. PTI5]|uniref:hypothetical protein n=1 Tax=Candidatus Pristimantibacillus sp. PTI5 TaxID=3400422 RepID=UPI003B02B4BA